MKRAQDSQFLDFTSTQICHIVGIEPNLLKQWIFRGHFKPTGYKIGGEGTRHMFTWGDVYRLAVFKALNRVGFTREHAADHVRNLSNSDVALADIYSESEHRYLVASLPDDESASRVEIKRELGFVQELLGNGEHVIIIDLKNIYLKLHCRVYELLCGHIGQEPHDVLGNAVDALISVGDARKTDLTAPEEQK
ncbi:MAG: hypothetical protein LLG06_11800 [Desulfobacteraceae bacterium]|nr:hypothetical protein [Desulfobacteraceae bacterium]